MRFSVCLSVCLFKSKTQGQGRDTPLIRFHTRWTRTSHRTPCRGDHITRVCRVGTPLRRVNTYNESSLVLSGILQSAFHEHIYFYTRTHYKKRPCRPLFLSKLPFAQKRRSDAKRRHVLASHGRSSSLSALFAEQSAHPPTYTHPFPRGTEWRQCMRQCHPRPLLSRVTACPLVCACSESTPHHERATKALPNSPSFPHSPSSVRLLTSSHIICSACRNRSPLTRHLGCWTLRLPPP